MQVTPSFRFRSLTCTGLIIHLKRRYIAQKTFDFSVAIFHYAPENIHVLLVAHITMKEKNFHTPFFHELIPQSLPRCLINVNIRNSPAVFRPLFDAPPSHAVCAAQYYAYTAFVHSQVLPFSFFGLIPGFKGRYTLHRIYRTASSFLSEFVRFCRCITIVANTAENYKYCAMLYSRNKHPAILTHLPSYKIDNKCPVSGEAARDSPPPRFLPPSKPKSCPNF